MKPLRSRPVTLALCAMALLLAGAAPAQGPAAAPGVYRCGNSYGTNPCPGGKPVAVDDSRTEAERRQAQAIKDQDARLAGELATERRARERAAIGQKAARLGPSDAERHQAEAQAAREKAKAEREAKKEKKSKREPRPPKNA